MTHTWLAQNGVGGLTAQAARAIFQHFLESARELDTPQLMALLRHGQDQPQPQSLPSAPALPGQQESQQPLPQQQQQPLPISPPLGGQRQAMDPSMGSIKRPGEDGQTTPSKVLVTTTPESWADADHNAPATPLEAAKWMANS